MRPATRAAAVADSGGDADPHACGGLGCITCDPRDLAAQLRRLASSAADLADCALPPPRRALRAAEPWQWVVFVGQPHARPAHLVGRADPTKTLCGNRPAEGRRFTPAADERRCLVCTRLSLEDDAAADTLRPDELARAGGAA